MRDSHAHLVACRDPPAGPDAAAGFRAALALYPGCRAQTGQDCRPYAPLLLLIAGADQEVSPLTCEQLAAEVRGRGVARLDMVVYPGAVHAFDDPGRVRQSNDANQRATADAKRRAEEFFSRNLQGP